MEENITLSTHEEQALQTMEHFDNPTIESLCALDDDECARMCKDMLDAELAMQLGRRIGASTAHEQLRAFHARHRMRVVRKTAAWVAAAAVVVGAIVVMFGRDFSADEKPMASNVNYIYKARKSPLASVSFSSESKGSGGMCQQLCPYGSTLRVVLPDGSEATLNSGSRLTYPAQFSGTRREVNLYGEAFFSVKKDARHPFVVKSGSINTTVLGTQFDVKNYGTATPTVTLVEGKVMLTDSLGTHHLILKPGQSASMGQQGELRLNTDTDVESSLSWKEGYLYYDNVSLEQMMNEVGRWYNVDVICRNPRAISTRVHCYIPGNVPIVTAVDMINKLGIARVAVEEGRIVVK